MVSDGVRKQVDEIQGQGVRRLQELSPLVLLLVIPIFVLCWCWSLALTSAIISDDLARYLYFSVVLFIAGLVLFFIVVRYFWRFRNTPLFHVLFIARNEAEKQVDTARFFRLCLLPVGVSIGLAVTMVPYELYPGYWWSSEHTLWWSLGHTPLTLWPVISVASSSIALYYAYHINPERVQRSAPWLLCIPLILSIFYVGTNVELYPIPTEVIGRLSWLSATSWFGAPSSPENIWLAIVWTTFGYRGLFLTSLIVLLYLLYSINVEQRKASTFAEGGHLREFIEKGVGILPKRVRTGHSYHIALDLTPSKGFMNRASHVEDHHASREYLETELQAPGLTVDGEKLSRVHETSPLPVTMWTCHFSESGIQTINLLIRVIKPDNSRHLVFRQHHIVEVDNLLNISWAPIAILIAPILAAVVQALLKLR
ncbi:MAG: hypothetical protein ACXVIF_07050 [Halobacteriota archaeon]